MVTVMLQFRRATQTGNWKLHLACVKAFLPWFFAYDRMHYARYASVYYCNMVLLNQTHPEAHAAFERGDFVVQRSEGSHFSQVAVDQTIEQTVNRHSKSSGGIVGCRTKHGATQRWMLTAHDRADILSACQHAAGLTTERSAAHKEVQPGRMKKDEQDVQHLLDTLAGWCNPFDTHGGDDLTSLSSGAAACKTVAKDLTEAYVKGTSACSKFLQDRLASGNVGFHEKLPMLKLRMFTSKLRGTKRISKTTKREVVLKTDKNFFAHLVVLAQARHLN